MKRVIKRMTAVILAVTVMCGTVMGNYQEAQAADLSAGALQYGLDLSFLESLFMAGGASLGLDMLLKTQNDINNWDWGDLLDDPMSQKQIDDAQEKIEKLYYGATEAYKKTHGSGSKPTPTPMITDAPAPGITPPVTVAPINPDDVTMPDDWATMKKNATENGVLAMGAATAYCVKEAIKGWWDDIMNTETEYSVADNKFAYKDLVGKIESHALFQGRDATETCYIYRNSSELKQINVNKSVLNSNKNFFVYYFSVSDKKRYLDCYRKIIMTNGYKSSHIFSNYSDSPLSEFVGVSDVTECSSTFTSYIPYTLDGTDYDAETKPLGKSSMWPSTDTKDDYDNNNSFPTPSYPNLAVPSITLPSLDEIKDLWKQGSDDEENRPTYVTNFITNHTVDPSTDPDPTQAPDANPTPTVAVAPVPGGKDDPETSPSPSTTPAVVPDPDGGTDPQPSGSPDQGSGGDGDTDTDNPEDPTPEEEASPYKADLREIFPFCIPFDLIHLLKVFEADAEAPVFEFPLDIEMDNPWTGEKVVDYHHTFKLDMSDYEEVIKILRIFQVIFFIIALMLITRQQMIKG